MSFDMLFNILVLHKTVSPRIIQIVQISPAAKERGNPILVQIFCGHLVGQLTMMNERRRPGKPNRPQHRHWQRRRPRADLDSVSRHTPPTAELPERKRCGNKTPANIPQILDPTTHSSSQNNFSFTSRRTTFMLLGDLVWMDKSRDPWHRRALVSVEISRVKVAGGQRLGRAGLRASHRF